MDPIEQDAKQQLLNTMTFGLHPLALIGGALLIIFICAIAYIVQSGLLATIEVKTTQPKRGSMMIAYKTGKGPYKGAGELFTEACCLVLNKDHIGIYYDDPEAVPEADLRFAVGVILSLFGLAAFQTIFCHFHVGVGEFSSHSLCVTRDLVRVQLRLHLSRCLHSIL